MKIDTVKLSKRWLNEGCKNPTKQCRRKAKKLYKLMLKFFNIKPTYISASVEDGIFLRYDLPNNKQLKIEVYNDLDIAGLFINGDTDKSFMINSLQHKAFLEWGNGVCI